MDDTAKTCNLTAYDAAYLEVAMKKDTAIGNLNGQLVKAAKLLVGTYGGRAA